MLTVTKVSSSKCFYCGKTEGVIEAKVDGRDVPLCWKDAEKVFNAHAGVKSEKKKKGKGATDDAAKK